MFLIKGKIPIRIYPVFWLLAAFIAWQYSSTMVSTSDIAISMVVCIVIITLSVLIHEYGHALAAIYFGQKAHIDLVGMGGLTHRHGEKIKLWQDFIIVLNGPLFGLLVAGTAFSILAAVGEQLTSFWIEILIFTVNVNVFWTIVNLLPVNPLDGGRLFSIILEAIFGIKGVKIALFLSLIISGLIGVLFFALRSPLAGSVFFLLAFENYRAWANSLPVEAQDQNVELQKLLKMAEKERRDGKDEEAIKNIEEIKRQTSSGIIFETATSLEAQIFSSQGRYREAYQLLLPFQKNLSVDSLHFLHQLAYQLGEWEEVIQLGDRSYQSYPNYETALINALSYSILGRVAPAVGWLKCAIKDGLPNSNVVLSKTEFDTIRKTAPFQELKSEIRE